MILVIDDDPGTRATTALLLQVEGYEVATAESGREALDLARMSSFDAAIVDYHLPDASGSELVLRLKEALPTTVFALVTAYPDDDFVTNAESSVADECVCGPMLADELVCLVARMSRRMARLTTSHQCKSEPSKQTLERLDPRVRQAVPLIGTNLSSEYSSSDIAAKFALSESRFRHLFSSAVGISLTRFVQCQRLAVAARRLCESFERAKVIAFDAGFRDLSRFRMAFRRRYGFAPSRYRVRFRRDSEGSLLPK